MIDDWQDLEGDLAAGHYSYVTLGYAGLVEMKDPGKTASLLRGDPERVRETYAVSKEMINRSRAILERLEDEYLVRFVDVTELRLENYFRKELKMDSRCLSFGNYRELWLPGA